MLKSYYYEGLIEAGCDEAGRGCLAGSVYAAAVILPKDYQNAMLNDSKQLSEKKRYMLREQIERDAVAWAVGVVTPEEIDQINILNASFLAMHRALDQLAVRPEAVIVDGNRFQPYYEKFTVDGLPFTDNHGQEATLNTCKPSTVNRQPLPHTCIIKGDGKQKSYERTQVVTGLSNGVNIEIKEGLTAKDKVRGPQVVAEEKE